MLTFTEAVLEGNNNLLRIDEDDTGPGDRDDSLVDSDIDTDTDPCYTYTIMLLGQCVVMCQEEILRLC